MSIGRNGASLEQFEIFSWSGRDLCIDTEAFRSCTRFLRSTAGRELGEIGDRERTSDIRSVGVGTAILPEIPTNPIVGNAYSEEPICGMKS